MPEDEKSPDPFEAITRYGNQAGNPDLDGGIIPSEICHTGIGSRPKSNAAITVAPSNGGKLAVSALPGEHSWILRDAFEDAIRSYLKDEARPGLLNALATLPNLRLEITCDFADLPSLSDDSLAQRLAFSVAVILQTDWEDVRSQAAKYGAAWVSARGQDSSGRTYFEYCLAVCHHASTMEELVRKYQEVQQERERIDAERDQWLHGEAEPFLDTLRGMLSDATLPEVDREKLQTMFQEVRRDAYYRGVISTADAANILERTEQIARRHARKGTVGFDPGQRNYVFNELDVEAFSRLDRPPGGDQTKKRKN